MSGGSPGFRHGLIVALCLLFVLLTMTSTGLARLAKTHGVIDVFVCELEPRSGSCTPRAGVFIFIEPPGEHDNTIRAVSDLQGRARFEVPAGEGYRLKTACKPYLPGLIDKITVGKQMSTELTVPLRADLGPVGSLRVVPPQGASPDALTGARVEVELVGESVVWVFPLVRGEDGAFFAHLPADRLYQVRVRRPGHAPSQTEQVRIQIGEVVSVAMALDSAAAVRTADR